MKALSFAVLGAAALFVAACLPVTTENPVGTTAGFKPDPALAGSWRASDKDGTPAYLHFWSRPNGKMLAIIFESPHQHSDGSASMFELETAMLGANRYMNARELGDDGKPNEPRRPSFPLLYSIAGHKTLTLSLLDEEATREAIKSGKVKGEIEPGQSGDIRITADTAALDKMFASAQGRALFRKPLLVAHRLD